MQNETGFEPDKEKGQGKIKDEREQESQPPAYVSCRVRCRCGHETANVDEEIEPQHDSLSAMFRVFDYSFTRFESLDFWYMRFHLVQQEGCDIWLKHGCEEKS